MTQRTDRLRSRRARGGISLIDMLMTIAVLAIVAAVAVPALNDSHRLRVRGAASILASDIEFAQSMSVAYPNDPIVIVFDTNDNSYHLARSSDPQTPLQRSDSGEPYVVTFGSGRARTAQNVTYTLDNVTDDEIAFSPHGGLESFNQRPRINLRHTQATDLPDLRMVIDPMTGTITESWH